MKLYKHWLLAASLGILTFSCADESPWGANQSAETGKIKLYLSSSADVSSKIPSVRSASTDIVTPEVSDFQIRLSDVSGSYAKTWNSLEEFEKESSFAAGTYILEAFYGTPTTQGVVLENDKGHEHSYFYGSTDSFRVEPGKDTSIQLQVSLANSIVVIEFTDAFKNYFSDWNTELITRGEETLSIGNREGMCYVVPGDIDIVISATQQNGKTVRVNPAVFEAEPQHMYKIRYNIYNGEIGQADQLELVFDDDVEENSILIDLTDDLFSNGEPVVTLEGYDSDIDIENLYGYNYEGGGLKYIVSSNDGISEAILSITSLSGNFEATFLSNNAVNLIGADENIQQEISAAGIRAVGFFHNPDKMAYLDITDFVSTLPADDYTIKLSVKDKASRFAESPKINIKTYPIDLDFIKQHDIKLGENYADLIVSYNGIEDPTDPSVNSFRFEMQNGAGSYEEVNIISKEKMIDTRSYDTKNYIFRVSLPSLRRDEYDVRMYYRNSEQPHSNKTIDVIYPAYNVEYDAMARRILIRVSDESGQLYPEIMQFLRVYTDGTEILPENFEFNPAAGIVIIKGMEPGKTFSEIKTTLKVTPKDAIDYVGNRSISTELAAEVPNGNFENLSVTYNKSVNQGGSWNTSILDFTSNYQNTSEYTISEANEWSSSNIKTMSGSNDNTWFCQPSVFNTTLNYTGKCPGVWPSTGSESGTPSSYSGFKTHSGSNAMVIRNVAWDPSGTTPAKDTDGKVPSGYFNKNVPSIANVSVGKMFLGEYPSSENIEMSKGKEFVSRPHRLTGWYTYQKDKGGQDDYGMVEIIVFNGNTPIARGKANLTENSEMTQFNIDLDQYGFNEKATRICIMAVSSKFASTSQAYENENVNVSQYLSKIESYKHGATLVLDDLRFIYE